MSEGVLQTVLVVEDESAILHLVRVIPEAAEFEVRTADSAAQALTVEAGFRRPIHLLLSDITMPGTSGPALVAAIKQSRPGIRVILMSGYPDGAQLVLKYGRQVGANGD